MINQDYRNINYRNVPADFYLALAVIKYRIAGFTDDEDERTAKYRRDVDPWRSIVASNIEYVDYENNKKKKKKSEQ